MTSAQGAGKRPVLIVVRSMDYDLAMVGIGPMWEPDADGGAAPHRAQIELMIAAYEAWARAARRIGAEWGYEVETHPDPGGVLPNGALPTYTPFEDGPARGEERRTVEDELSKAAEDAFEVRKRGGKWIVAETVISPSPPDLRLT